MRLNAQCLVLLLSLTVLACSSGGSTDKDIGQAADLSLADQATDLSPAGDTTTAPDLSFDQSLAPDQSALQDLAPADVSTADLVADTQAQSCSLGGGCPPQQHCIPAGPGESLVCAPIGTTSSGADCEPGTLNQCVEGAVCIDYDSSASWCVRLCSIGSTEKKCSESYQFCYPWFGPAGSVAGICIGDDCRPPASGCANDRRCTVLAGPVFQCVPAGNVPEGGDCSTHECVAGTICRTIDGESRCRAFCTKASDCSDPDSHCVYWPELGEWGYCRPGCDPLRQTGCKNDEACYFGDPEIGSTLCLATGTLDEGADCSSFTELCKPGLDCVIHGTAPNQAYFCRAYCDSEHPCQNGTCQVVEALKRFRVCMP